MPKGTVLSSVAQNLSSTDKALAGKVLHPSFLERSLSRTADRYALAVRKLRFLVNDAYDLRQIHQIAGINSNEIIRTVAQSLFQPGKGPFNLYISNHRVHDSAVSVRRSIENLIQTQTPFFPGCPDSNRGNAFNGRMDASRHRCGEQRPRGWFQDVRRCTNLVSINSAVLKHRNQNNLDSRVRSTNLPDTVNSTIRRPADIDE